MIRHGRPTGHEIVFEFDPVGYFDVTRPKAQNKWRRLVQEYSS